jgi:hypothetical protein
MATQLRKVARCWAQIAKCHSHRAFSLTTVHLVVDREGCKIQATSCLEAERCTGARLTWAVESVCWLSRAHLRVIQRENGLVALFFWRLRD